MKGRPRCALETLGAAVLAVSLLLTAVSGHCSEAVSFYPLCNTKIEDINTPLLVLMGEKDNVTHAYLCKAMLPLESTSKELIFKNAQMGAAALKTGQPQIVPFLTRSEGYRNDRCRLIKINPVAARFFGK